MSRRIELKNLLNHESCTRARLNPIFAQENFEGLPKTVNGVNYSLEESKFILFIFVEFAMDISFHT